MLLLTLKVELYLEFMIGVVPLSLCGIAYERVKTVPSVYNVNCVFPAWKILLLTWGVSAILSCHRFLTYEYFTIEDGNTSEIPESLVSEFNILGDGNYNDSSVMMHNMSACRKVRDKGKWFIVEELTHAKLT